MKLLVYLLWGIETSATAHLLALMLYRRAWHTHTAFLGYVAFCSATNAAMMTLALSKNWTIFLMAQPITKILGAILAACVAASLVSQVCRPFKLLPRSYAISYLLSVLAITLVAAAVTAAIPGRPMLAIDSALTWVSLAVFGFISLYSDWLGFSWRHRAYGIGLGFLVCTGGETVRTITFWLLPRHSRVLDLILMTSYLAALTIWTWHFYTPETSLRTPPVAEVRRVADLLRIQALAVSYTPTFRGLTRSNIKPKIAGK